MYVCWREGEAVNVRHVADINKFPFGLGARGKASIIEWKAGKWPLLLGIERTFAFCVTCWWELGRGARLGFCKREL